MEKDATRQKQGKNWEKTNDNENKDITKQKVNCGTQERLEEKQHIERSSYMSPDNTFPCLDIKH